MEIHSIRLNWTPTEKQYSLFNDGGALYSLIVTANTLSSSLSYSVVTAMTKYIALGNSSEG